jgi:hypothetical protein
MYLLFIAFVAYVMVVVGAKFDAVVGLGVGVDLLDSYGFTFSTVFWYILDKALLDVFSCK